MENTNQPQQPELTIQDLVNIRSVFDVAARRGAFQTSELSAVGAVYDKLNNFLKAVAPAETKAEESAAPASESTSDASEAELRE